MRIELECAFRNRLVALLGLGFLGPGFPGLDYLDLSFLDLRFLDRASPGFELLALGFLRLGQLRPVRFQRSLWLFRRRRRRRNLNGSGRRAVLHESRQCIEDVGAASTADIALRGAQIGRGHDEGQCTLWADCKH